MMKTKFFTPLKNKRCRGSSYKVKVSIACVLPCVGNHIACKISRETSFQLLSCISCGFLIFKTRRRKLSEGSHYTCTNQAAISKIKSYANLNLNIYISIFKSNNHLKTSVTSDFSYIRSLHRRIFSRCRNYKDRVFHSGFKS